MRYCITDPAAYQLSEEELEAALASPDPDAAAEDSNDVDPLFANGVPEAEDTAISSTAVCPLCLGCLQHCVRPAAIAAVADVVTSSGHELRDFALAISVPVQLLLRERAAWLHLQRARAASTAAAGGGFTLIGPSHGRAGAGSSGGRTPAGGVAGTPRYDKIVDVKEAMRNAMGPALARALGVKCEVASALVVHVHLSHKGCAGGAMHGSSSRV